MQTLPPMVLRRGMGLFSPSGSGNSSAGSEFATGVTPPPGLVVCPPGSQVDPSNTCTDNVTGQTVAPVGQIDANGQVVPVTTAPSFTPAQNGPLVVSPASGSQTQVRAGVTTATQGTTSSAAPVTEPAAMPGATVLAPVVSAGDSQVTAPGAAASTAAQAAAQVPQSCPPGMTQDQNGHCLPNKQCAAGYVWNDAQAECLPAPAASTTPIVPVVLTVAVGAGLLWWWLS